MIEHSQSTIGKQELAALSEVTRSNFLAEGEVVRRFEEKIASMIGAPGAVASSTGTLALHLALLTLGLEPSDKVIVPSYICRSVLNALYYCRLQPIVCDIEEDTYNLSFKQVRKKMSKGIKAILLAHMFGLPCSVDRFKDLGVPVIEDCAHAPGAQYKGRLVGGFGDLAIFSFEGTKMLSTGEGGMVVANSRKFLNRLRALKEPCCNDLPTKYTYRMTNMQAAVGLVQLKRLPDFIRKRNAIASVYHRAFDNFDIVSPQVQYHDRCHIYHRYVIQIKGNIQVFMKYALSKGVKIKQPIKPMSLHQYLQYDPKYFPVTEYVMKKTISIPIYPNLSSAQVKYIIETVRPQLSK